MSYFKIGDKVLVHGVITDHEGAGWRDDVRVKFTNRISLGEMHIPRDIVRIDDGGIAHDVMRAAAETYREKLREAVKLMQENPFVCEKIGPTPCGECWACRVRAFVESNPAKETA